MGEKMHGASGGEEGERALVEEREKFSVREVFRGAFERRRMRRTGKKVARAVELMAMGENEGRYDGYDRFRDLMRKGVMSEEQRLELERGYCEAFLVEKAQKLQSVEDLSELSKYDIERKAVNYRNIDEAVRAGVRMESIMGNEKVKDVLVGQLVCLANNQLNGVEGDRVFQDVACGMEDIYEELMQDEKYREQVVSQVDVQAFGQGALWRARSEDLCPEEFKGIYGEKEIEHSKALKRGIEFWRDLGFEPFADESDVVRLVQNRRENGYMQRGLAEMGVLSGEVVSRMYRHHFEAFKGRMKGEHYDRTILSTELVPSEDDRMANYWREQSKGLGYDMKGNAMEVIENYFAGGKIGEYDIFGELDDEEMFERSWMKSAYESYANKESFPDLTDEMREEWKREAIAEERKKWTLFDRDGIPAPGLFRSDNISKPMNKLRMHHWEGRRYEMAGGELQMMRFMAQNIDRMEGEDKGFMTTWKGLEVEDREETKSRRELFMLYATGDHNFQEGFFDENGVTENFYKKARFCDEGIKAVKLIEGWEGNFSETELAYMAFMEKYPTFQRISTLDREPGIPARQEAFMEKYFDENGPRAELATELFEKQRDAILDKEELIELLSIEQQAYIKMRKDKKFGGARILETMSVEDVEKCFSGGEMSLELWQWAFSNGGLELLLAQSEEVVEEMKLNEGQKQVVGLAKIGGVKLLNEMIKGQKEGVFVDGAPTEAFFAEVFNGGNYSELCTWKEGGVETGLGEEKGKVLELWNELMKGRGSRPNPITGEKGGCESAWAIMGEYDKRIVDLLIRSKSEDFQTMMDAPVELASVPEGGEFEVTQENILSCLSAFMHLDANDWSSKRIPSAVQEKIKEAFTDTRVKDMALGELQGKWLEYLRGGEVGEFPYELSLFAQHNERNDGAGPLTQVESFLNFMGAYRENADSLYESTRAIEERFRKEKWERGEVSSFYEISAEVISASPEVYADFVEFFEKVPDKGDFGKFVKEVYPLYRAKLALLKGRDEIGGNGVGGGRSVADYSKLDKEKLRGDLGRTLLVFNLQELSPDLRKEGVERVKGLILGEIRGLFSEKFGVVESAVPETFEAEHIRSLENMTLYYSNIAHRDQAVEDLIGFYLATMMEKGGWGALRGGEGVDAGRYLVPERAGRVGQVLQAAREGSVITGENIGVGEERVAEFTRALQAEEEVMRIGSVQTIDLKLQNLIGNIADLRDPDLYPDEMDKKRIAILERFSVKTVGRVAAGMHQELGGRRQEFNEEQGEVRAELLRLLEGAGVEVTQENVKEYLQDGFKLLSPVFNIGKQVEESGAIEEVAKLQRMLEPSKEIVEIFNGLGEDFTPSSGAMAFGEDLDFLENLIVKKEDLITEEQRELLNGYLGEIRAQMGVLEGIYSKVSGNFQKIQGSVHGGSEEQKKKIEEISRIMQGGEQRSTIITSCTGNLNAIIENMRACLSCKTKGINNDTNLSFAEPYKFFLYSRDANNKMGSISDEIVYFVPVESEEGGKRMSFVMDRMYGRKSSDVFYGHVETMVKKLKLLKKGFPEAEMSVMVTKAAMESAGVMEDLMRKEVERMGGGLRGENVDLKVNIPKSAFGDHYIEFGSGGARITGERMVEGVEIFV